MSKALRTVAVVAGAVALVATGVGAAAGAGLFGAAATGSAGVVAGVSVSTIATVASVASAVGMAASIGAQLTAKKPPARGTVNEVIISAEPPAPYVIGRTYSGGVLRHDVGYGDTLKKVPNPYRGQVIEYSVAGPCDGLENVYADYAVIPFSGSAATGYYSGFLYRDVRLGLNAETALVPHFAGMPNWTSAHKLSGKAAILLNGKFDKDGKRFASGWPATGAVWRGVKTYDARKDSTYPGGSGSHRLNDEGTWEYSEDPGQHALAYALGRFRNGKKVFGVGLPLDGIIVDHFVELSNVCTANNWTVGGVIYEPGDRWANLKRILEAGAAEPLFIGGKLGLRINTPRVSVYDLTASDLAEDDAEIPAAKTWRERRNGIRPKFRSETNKWSYVSSDLVSIPAYIEEDGEEKFEEMQWDLVQRKDQVAQLAAYKLVNGREIGPITLVCKPHMRQFGPGDMITLNLGADHALGGVDAVILKRSVDPGTMKVTLTLETETGGKHDFALGRTGTAPPSPALAATEDKDVIAASVIRTDEIPWTGVLDDDPAHPKPEDGATVGMTPDEASMLSQLATDLAAAETLVNSIQAQVDTDLAALNGQIDTINSSLLELNEEIAGINPSSQPNQLDNGGFENALTGWFSNNAGAAPTGWTHVPGGAAWGTHVTNSATGTYGLERKTPAAAGSQYTLAADVRAIGSGGGTAQLYLEFRDAGGAIVAGGTFTGAVIANGTDFDVTDAGRKANKVTATAPAGTTQVTCKILFTGMAGTVNVAVRRVKFERGDKATAFSSEASSYTAYQTGVSNAGTIATLNSTVSTQGSSISSLQSSMTSAQGSIATLTNTLQATGNPNLITNGTFENGITGWASNRAGWNNAYNNLWASYAYNQTNFPAGEFNSLSTDVIAGSGTYTLTYDANYGISGGTGSLVAQIQWLDGSGTMIGFANAADRAANSVGFDTGLVNRAASKFTITAPAGTVKLRVVFYFNKASGTIVECDLRLVKLEAGSISTAYSGEASLRQVYTVANTATSSVASLSSSLSTTNANVSSLQSAMSTAQGDVATLKTQVRTGGGNLMGNTAFINTNGWVNGLVPGWGASAGMNGAGADWKLPWENNLYIYQPNTFSDGNSSYWLTDVSVIEGKWYELSALLASHRCGKGMQIQWLNTSGGLISTVDGAYAVGAAGGKYVSGWQNVAIKGQAPSGTVVARCVFYKNPTNAGPGISDSWFWMCRPQLTETTQNASQVAFAPSGNGAVIDTINQSVNGVLAKYGVTLDVNGYITGFQQINNGSSGSFIVNADYFAVGKAGAAASYPFEIIGGTTYIKNAVIKSGVVTNNVVGEVSGVVTRASGGTWDGASAGFTCEGGRVRVDVSLDAWKTASSTHTAIVQIVRSMGGVDTLVGRPVTITQVGNAAAPLTWWYVDNPGAGAVQYRIRVSRDSGTGTLAYANQAIAAEETKS